MTATTAFGSGVIDLEDLAEVALLSEATEIESVLREGEVHKLRIAYQWAIAHPALDACETPSGPVLPSVLTEPETLGRPRDARGGGVHARAARASHWAARLRPPPRLLADALDLHHRLPLAVGPDPSAARAGLEGAPGRLPQRAHLSLDAARWVDRQVAGRVSSLSAPALDRLVAEAAARCDGDELADREQAQRDALGRGAARTPTRAATPAPLSSAPRATPST